MSLGVKEIVIWTTDYECSAVYGTAVGDEWVGDQVENVPMLNLGGSYRDHRIVGERNLIPILLKRIY